MERRIFTGSYRFLPVPTHCNIIVFIKILSEVDSPASVPKNKNRVTGIPVTLLSRARYL